MVIFEDEYIIAIHKPSGLIVHAGVGTEGTETLADWILATYPALKDVGEDERRPGIVHRLDKETSGVMVLAKTNDVFFELKKLFQKGKVRKEYHAFVYGSPRFTRGVVSLGLGRSKKDFRKRAARSIRGGKRDAVTEYIHAGSCEGNISLMRFYPHTGRTHQIRVHAQNLQTPIVCDRMYASGRDAVLGFTRLALHARRISLQLHMYEKPVHIIAPYPSDFEQALQQCMIISKERDPKLTTFE